MHWQDQRRGTLVCFDVDQSAQQKLGAIFTKEEK